MRMKVEDFVKKVYEGRIESVGERLVKWINIGEGELIGGGLG